MQLQIYVSVIRLVENEYGLNMVHKGHEFRRGSWPIKCTSYISGSFSFVRPLCCEIGHVLAGLNSARFTDAAD